jgi:uncharacterized protein with HEPN domain
MPHLPKTTAAKARPRLMRNALIHGYDSVNLVTVWNTIQNDLPILKHQLTALSPD